MCVERGALFFLQIVRLSRRTCGELPLVSLRPATSQRSRCSSFDTAPALAVVCIFQLPLCALHPLVEHLFASPPALEYISPAPLMKYTAPVLAVYAAPASVVQYIFSSSSSFRPAGHQGRDVQRTTRHEAMQRRIRRPHICVPEKIRGEEEYATESETASHSS